MGLGTGWFFYTPTMYWWDMDRAATLDAKGRIVIPVEFREDLGGHVLIRKTEEGVLLIPREEVDDFAANFLRMIEAGPRRTKTPTYPSPAKMKSIWKEGR